MGGRSIKDVINIIWEVVYAIVMFLSVGAWVSNFLKVFAYHDFETLGLLWRLLGVVTPLGAVFGWF